jgi:hypothetical protein
MRCPSVGGSPVRGPGVLAEHRHVLAHLLQARDRAQTDLVGQLVRRGDVGGQHDAALVLVARVDQRVELLEDPRAGLLGPDVVDVQQVDLGQAVQQLGVGLRGVVVERRAQLGQQTGQGVDGDGAARVDRGPRDEHGQRRLARPDLAEQPQAAPLVEVLLDAAGEVADDADLHRGHLGDRRRVEGHEPVLAGDDGRQAARAGAGHPRGAAAAVRRGVGLLVDDEPAAVADVEGAVGGHP